MRYFGLVRGTAMARAPARKSRRFISKSAPIFWPRKRGTACSRPEDPSGQCRGQRKSIRGNSRFSKRDGTRENQCCHLQDRKCWQKSPHWLNPWATPFRSAAPSRSKASSILHPYNRGTEIGRAHV